MPASGDTGTFEWKDYSPRVFCALRAALGVDNAEYLLSLTKEGALRRLPSPGKSGSVFFLSDDGRFVIKSVRKGELRLLQRLLPAYCEHVAKFPRTLLNHFYGLHRVAPLAGRRVRFLVMGNVFPTDLRLHRKYDLKGSALGRTSLPAGLSDPWAMLKDLDLDVTFLLAPEHHAALARQLARDCALLEAAHVMDYSLLLGVHYVRWGNRAWAPPRGDWARARE
ncbi:phosphatidylinositol-4-phosphate 5-kinase, partial [Helicosporidium sp. ATCC 50920]